MTDEHTTGDEVEGVGRHAAHAAGDRLRELAEQSEQEAEREAGDDDDEVPADAQLTDAPDELQAAHAAYVAAVADALGADAEIKPCDYCGGYGFNPIEFPADTHRTRCVDCDGWGTVESGSRVDSQRRLPCQTCNGNGWRPVPTPPPTSSLAPAQVPVLPAYVPPPPAAAGDSVGHLEAAGAPQP